MHRRVRNREREREKGQWRKKERRISEPVNKVAEAEASVAGQKGKTERRWKEMKVRKVTRRNIFDANKHP